MVAAMHSNIPLWQHYDPYGPAGSPTDLLPLILYTESLLSSGPAQMGSMLSVIQSKGKVLPAYPAITC